MRALIVSVVILWMPMTALADEGHHFAHVRSSDAALRALITTGYDRSPTFRALVDEIEAVPVVVYVERGSLRGTREGALMLMVGGSRELPVLRVLVRPDAAGTHWVGVVAHELQHVVEASRGKSLQNAAAMAALFAGLDRDHMEFGAFDTEAARDVARRVVAEVLASRAKPKKYNETGAILRGALRRPGTGPSPRPAGPGT